MFFTSRIAARSLPTESASPRWRGAQRAGAKVSKKSGKGKRPRKGGNSFWKSIRLGFKTPRDAIDGNKLLGPIPKALKEKANTTLELRYEKRHSNIPTHISPCFRMKEGDHVIIGQYRPLSKTVRFDVRSIVTGPDL